VKVEIVDREEEVEISIIDSGPGIPPDVAAQIMNPFFTTKEVGRGTGLGLSISQSLIKSHGGSLLLDSKHPNTCFRVVLPKNQHRLLDRHKKAS
jgi:signal transduction histidine kinase